MKLKVLGFALMGTFLAGCASTDGTPGSNRIDVKSTQEFIWDTEESFALNISRMGNRADLGLGLVDVNNPETMSIERESNSLLSFYSGFYAGGLLGGLGALSMDDMSEKARSWKPYFVQFVPKAEFDIKAEGSSKYIQSKLESSLSESLSLAFENSRLVGVYSEPRGVSPFENIVLIEGDACKEAFSGEVNDDYRGEGWADEDRDDVGTEIPAKGIRCSIPISSTVTGSFNGNYVVTHEVIAITSSLYLSGKLATSSDMAYVHPDFYRAKDVNTGKTIERRVKAPFVLYDGNIHLFDRDEISVSLF